VSLGAPDQKNCDAYGCKRTSTQVRLVYVVAPNGPIHAVMTSLLDAVAYPAAGFLYSYQNLIRFVRFKTKAVTPEASSKTGLQIDDLRLKLRGLSVRGGRG
jgi:hypothetical protein